VPPRQQRRRPDLGQLPDRRLTLRPIGSGSVLRVVAPSGPFDVAHFEAGVGFLRERYEVRYRADIVEREGYLAGSDRRRLDELNEALADPDAAAIVAARGGYGATRLLPELSVARVRHAAIPLIGFSDITALHALWAQAGVPSMHGSMVAALGRSGDATRASWVRALEGPGPALKDLERWTGGAAEGPLVGGNLAVLGALVGTPHAPPLDGAILLLEDIGERPYRMDRVLTSLGQAGWLARVAGVVVGELTDCAPGPDGVPPEAVLRERLGDLGIPVAGALPVGHGACNTPLWLGRVHRLDADAGTLEPVLGPQG